MTYQDNRRLVRSALAGNAKAEQKLRKNLTRLAKQANKKMKALEVEGLTASPAYKLAQDDLKYLRKQRKGRTKVRFPESNRSLGIVEVANLLWSVEQYLGRKTSTVKGYRENRANRLGFLKDIGIDIAGREQQFDDFMRTNWFNEFVKFDSGEAFQTIENMLDQGVEPERVNELFEEYEKGNMDFLQVTYNWEEVI